MLAKDSVKVRLDKGLSFTEFSYMLLQAYDFLYLYRTKEVELQMGGADQWGNITAGLELIRRTSASAVLSSGSEVASFADMFVTGQGPYGEEETIVLGDEPAHGLAYKLLLSPSGAKFGKTDAGQSIWLDAARTSVYDFYQYWVNIDDRDVGTYLRWFTEFDRDRIEQLDQSTQNQPEARIAQRHLALDITARTHGHDLAAEVSHVADLVATHELGRATISWPRLAIGCRRSQYAGKQWIRFATC